MEALDIGMKQSGRRSPGEGWVLTFQIRPGGGFNHEYQSCNFHRDQEMTHMCIVVTSRKSREAAFGHGPAAVNMHFWEKHYLTPERSLAEGSNLLFSF